MGFPYGGGCGGNRDRVAEHLVVEKEVRDPKRIGAFPCKRINLDDSVKVFHLPTWKKKDDPTRIAALRRISLEAGRDPRIATQAVKILKAAGIRPRDTKGQAAALLKWVQTQIYYVNEPGERLQDPIYTLTKAGYGDCDDMAMVLAAFLESLRIPWRFVLSGQTPQGKLVRWIEGQPRKRARWSHIYVVVGDQPYKPKKWIFAEPTLNVPFGWDIVSSAKKNGKVALPELAGPDLGAVGWGSLGSMGYGQIAPGEVVDVVDMAVIKGVDRAPMMVKRTTEEITAFQHIKKKIGKRLQFRELIPTVAIALVTGYILTVIRGREKK